MSVTTSRAQLKKMFHILASTDCWFNAQSSLGERCRWEQAHIFTYSVMFLICVLRRFQEYFIWLSLVKGESRAERHDAWAQVSTFHNYVSIMFDFYLQCAWICQINVFCLYRVLHKLFDVYRLGQNRLSAFWLPDWFVEVECFQRRNASL